MAKVFVWHVGVVTLSLALVASLALGQAQDCAANVEEAESVNGAALLQTKSSSDKDVERLPYVPLLASPEEQAKRRVAQLQDVAHQKSAEKIEKQMVADFKAIEVEVADKKTEAAQHAERSVSDKHAEAEKAETDAKNAAKEAEKKLVEAKKAAEAIAKERESAEKEAQKKAALVSEAKAKVAESKAEDAKISAQRKKITDEFLEKEASEKVESIKLKQKTQILNVTEEASQAIKDAEGQADDAEKAGPNADGDQTAQVSIKQKVTDASKVAQTQQAALDSARAEVDEQKQGHKAALEKKMESAKTLASVADAQTESEQKLKERGEAALASKSESVAADDIVASKKDAEKSAVDAVDAQENELRRLKAQKEATSKVKQRLADEVVVAKENVAAAMEERTKVGADYDYAAGDLANKTQEEQKAIDEAAAEDKALSSRDHPKAEGEDAEAEKSNAFGFRYSSAFLLAFAVGAHAY